jgi:hypothetical protein
VPRASNPTDRPTGLVAAEAAPTASLRDLHGTARRCQCGCRRADARRAIRHCADPDDCAGAGAGGTAARSALRDRAPGCCRLSVQISCLFLPPSYGNIAVGSTRPPKPQGNHRAPVCRILCSTDRSEGSDEDDLTGAGLLAGALLLGGGAAQAALIDYTAGGVNLVWDNDRGATGLTWLKNANLADTVDFGVTGIAADGTMTWAVAQDWITAMNAANYAGTNGWRLWSALNSNGTDPCEGFNCTGSELGHLFYTEGGLSQGQSITSSTALTEHFTNMQSSVY